MRPHGRAALRRPMMDRPFAFPLWVPTPTKENSMAATSADSPGSTVHAGLAARRKAGMFTLMRSPRALWRFLADRKAPMLPRIVAVITLLYVISPIDLI